MFARHALYGVGAAEVGEWVKRGSGVFHLRRRLTIAEAKLVGPVVDVRRTREGQRRYAAVRPILSSMGYAGIGVQ